MKHILNAYKKVKRNQAFPSFKDISHPKSISKHILFLSYVNYYNLMVIPNQPFYEFSRFLALIQPKQTRVLFYIDLSVYRLKNGGMI